MTAVGGGFLIGHSALAVLLPIAAAALAWGFRRHRRPLPLALGLLAAGIGYVHIFAGTPEWTVYGVMGLSLAAAFLDWRATRKPMHRSAPRLQFAPVVEA